ARFKERFGVNPRHVLGGSGLFERIGAEVELSGADAHAR
ncbi:AraC family transcriptional regulator, partial [Rhizobium ruizarguesonis]